MVLTIMPTAKSNNTPDLDKLVQARADKLTAEISKKKCRITKRA